MQRRFILFIASSVIFVAAVLLADRDGLGTQLALATATAGFLWRFARGSGIPRRQIVWSIVVASAGEFVLSVVWGLYTYQHFLIPLYVPPGHGLIYTLAADASRQDAFRRRAAAITRTVMISGSVVALVSLFVFSDTWGFLWWLGALILIARSRNQLLLSACLVFSTCLEWSGTAIGNWRWAPEVPFVGLQTANPPSGVGILYVLLDLIVVAITTGTASRRAAIIAAPSITVAHGGTASISEPAS